MEIFRIIFKYFYKRTIPNIQCFLAHIYGDFPNIFQILRKNVACFYWCFFRWWPNILDFFMTKMNSLACFCPEFLFFDFWKSKLIPFWVKKGYKTVCESKCVDLKCKKTAQYGFFLKNEMWSQQVFLHGHYTFFSKRTRSY